MRMPCSSSAGRRSFLRQRAWRVECSPTTRRMASSVSRGVRPSCSGVSMPASTWSCRPATRTMKNSSRLFEAIAENFSRSSSGTPSSSESSSTRWLNSSHDSSRLKYSFGSVRSTASSAGGCSRVLTGRSIVAGSPTAERSHRGSQPASSSRMPSRNPPRPIWSGRPSACAAASSTVSPAAISTTRSRSIANRRDTSSLASPESTRIARCSDSGVEHRPDEPAQRRGAAADRHRGVDRGQREALEHPLRVLAHRVQVGDRGRVRAQVGVGEQARAEAEGLRPGGAVGHRADRELRRPAADVDDADGAVERLAERARGAEEGQARLLLAVEDLDLDAADARASRPRTRPGWPRRGSPPSPRRASRRCRAARSAAAARRPRGRPRRSSRAGSRRP